MFIMVHVARRRSSAAPAPLTARWQINGVKGPLHVYNGVCCMFIYWRTSHVYIPVHVYNGAQINEVKERIAMKEGELIDIEAEFAVPPPRSPLALA